MKNMLNPSKVGRREINYGLHRRKEERRLLAEIAEEDAAEARRPKPPESVANLLRHMRLS